uniref:Uncharacterized protein n=1 Tax=Rousettus aegyptiacus TaxID=9407 RepID=A0A7J8F063_ROUAE|nr:hypothetical protein HJG63_012249 [Rousettus aegyptiacus]
MFQFPWVALVRTFRIHVHFVDAQDPRLASSNPDLEIYKQRCAFELAGPPGMAMDWEDIGTRLPASLSPPPSTPSPAPRRGLCSWPVLFTHIQSGSQRSAPPTCSDPSLFVGQPFLHFSSVTAHLICSATV